LRRKLRIRFLPLPSQIETAFQFVGDAKGASSVIKISLVTNYSCSRIMQAQQKFLHKIVFTLDFILKVFHFCFFNACLSANTSVALLFFFSVQFSRCRPVQKTGGGE
jgi:hypothetical protein